MRIFQRTMFYLYRAALGAGFVFGAAYLTNKPTPLLASLTMVAAAAVLCALVALLLKSQKPGKITFVNYAAGVALPLGYRIGRGRLLPIVICSWLGWSVLSVIGAVYPKLQLQAAASSPSGPPGTTFMVFLWISWVLNGLALLMCLRVLVMRPAASLIKPTAAMLLFFGGSVALWQLGHPVKAMLLSYAPILIFGGGYALFIVVVLITKPRWN